MKASAITGFSSFVNNPTAFQPTINTQNVNTNKTDCSSKYFTGKLKYSQQGIRAKKSFFFSHPCCMTQVQQQSIMTFISMKK